MNKAVADKAKLENAAIRKQEIRDDIETIGRHATWMLGILVLLIIALASFIFKYLGVELETGSIIWVVWHVAIFVCGIYSSLLLYYIRQLIAPDFDESPKESQEYEEVQGKVKQNAIRLSKLAKKFNTLLSLFVASAPTALLYGLALWHFAK